MKALSVKRLRKRMNVTQAELADELGVHRITVSHWENKNHKPKEPFMKELKRLRKLYA